jgi:hypothetical protein
MNLPDQDDRYPETPDENREHESLDINDIPIFLRLGAGEQLDRVTGSSRMKMVVPGMLCIVIPVMRIRFAITWNSALKPWE